jgi:hypothetical protein
MAVGSGGDWSDAELASAIMEYLNLHPRAMDTDAGILEWWLADRDVRAALPSVRRVLDDLVGRGLLEKVGIGEQAHYRLNK